MPNFSPSLDDISDLISRSRTVLDIFSPYVTAGPLDLLTRSLLPDVEVNVWTRLSPSDWVYGASDPEFLAMALDSLSGGHQVSLHVNQRLHAKAYFADRRFGLLGSANFTEGGFGRNIEVLVSMDGDEAATALSDLHKVLAESRTLPIAELIRWVEQHRELIEHSRSDQRDLAQQLSEAQRDLDIRLGYGTDSSQISEEPSYTLMEQFIAWLRRNTNLREADMVIKRYDNYQFLSGKAKQSICGVYRFLQEYPQFIDELDRAAQKPATQALYVPAQEIIEGWIEHLNQHAADAGECFNYSVLRGYLTPSFGGTCEGGTGGESTFKRVLPLMATFMKGKFT